MRRNYQRKLWGEIITGNYGEKLSQNLRDQKVGTIKKLSVQTTCCGCKK